MLFSLLVLLIIGCVVWGVITYNRLVVARSSYRKAFFQVEIHLQRQLGLAKKIVETANSRLDVTGLGLELVLSELHAARNNLAQALQVAKDNDCDPVVMDELVRAQEALERQQRVCVQALHDAEPSLVEQGSIGAELAEQQQAEPPQEQARSTYNEAVLAYNNCLELFPTNLIADFFDFQPAGNYPKSAPPADGSDQSQSSSGDFSSLL